MKALLAATLFAATVATTDAVHIKATSSLRRNLQQQGGDTGGNATPVPQSQPPTETQDANAFQVIPFADK